MNVNFEWTVKYREKKTCGFSWVPLRAIEYSFKGQERPLYTEKTWTRNVAWTIFSVVRLAGDGWIQNSARFFIFGVRPLNACGSRVNEECPLSLMPFFLFPLHKPHSRISRVQCTYVREYRAEPYAMSSFRYLLLHKRREKQDSKDERDAIIEKLKFYVHPKTTLEESMLCVEFSPSVISFCFYGIFWDVDRRDRYGFSIDMLSSVRLQEFRIV